MYPKRFRHSYRDLLKHCGTLLYPTVYLRPVAQRRVRDDGVNCETVAVQLVGNAICHVREVQRLSTRFNRLTNLRNVVELKLAFGTVIQVSQNVGRATLLESRYSRSSWRLSLCELIIHSVTKARSSVTVNVPLSLLGSSTDFGFGGLALRESGSNEAPACFLVERPGFKY